jgi:uncharacterized membrane protein SpoIIM required for sporulation/ABC-type transport system involved in multi-copper enzyme maturation permease subunit
MREHYASVALIAGRELRDQFRDWRIILPLTILTIAFPFLMSEVADQAVAFFAKYGTPLIAYRLVPFSILIIGFFPITVSLVVALESFVGEKERGTIEPLLDSPMENWHLYAGKLVAGIVAPLSASFLAVGLYLAMVAARHVQLPSPGVVLLLMVLTTAHALLMVSAAMVVSVQATSVRAANLLASFIVIPVAILLQGESVMLFWGGERVLWFAVLAVLIMAALLVRLGVAHFQREYLLGREFDTLSLNWVWMTFYASFRGGASSIPGWYRVQAGLLVRKLATPIIIVGALAVVGYGSSYAWTTANLPRLLSAASPKELVDLAQSARQSAGIAQLQDGFSAARILANNVRATLLILAGGAVSFSVLGIIAFIANAGIVGAALGVFKLAGYSPWLIVAAGLLPHGIFEIPALMLVSAAVLRLGACMVTPQTGKSMGEVLLDLLADCAKVFVAVVAPLLVVAALVEAYVTPGILLSVIK